MAAIHQNPMIKKSENMLVDIYTRIKSEKNIVIQDLDYDIIGNEAIPRVIENLMSLKTASEMSVKLLASTYPEETSLLYFLGCLPGGVMKEQLEKMWGVNDLTQSLERLRDLSFLEVGVDKLTLIPQMIGHIGENIDIISKKEYIAKICNFYKDLLLECYNKIKKSEHSV